ncbi:neurotransmitter:Na+ symporter, NSS family [Thermotomaculum hydrothermale]|uniref:Transporter n=1 Tax=Thermotomaculum hydrothermale TaxID=981385 RepID=A0A7R6PLQ6_9BACT|nr:sodium-dependent transporter [Thermotomaculum hydrothermale]BBB32407.1 neurotransmitter:Na+ symporter, NSS family [Thermotomaculum hydrothermale]
MQKREEWSSKLGFILAASGSAIGLGNIWRFPYITGANGGGAFVLIYLICVFVVAFPVMIVELVIGRKAKKNPVGAFKTIAPGSKWWIIGALGVIAGFGILSYYSVVAGWTLAYIIKAVSGGLTNSSVNPAEIFNNFAKNGVLQVTYLFVFSAFTVFVVIGGIKEGIEKAAKILLPLLFILMLLLIGYVLTLPNAMNGLKFYLIPDFSKVNSHTVLMAMGQAFFSLSLGMGAMITYGSYLPSDDDLFSSAFYVTFFDTLIAILAGFIIFPALGGAPSKSGPSLVFVVLVDVFRKIPFGEIIAIVFFILMAIAALTSTVSLLEVVTSYLIDEKKIERKKAAIGAGFVIALLGIPSALSLGANKFFTKIGFLDKMDFVFGNIFLTFGGLMMCLFVAYKWGLEYFLEHLSEGCEHVGKSHFNNWLKLAIYFICPLAIAVLLLYLLITGESLG